MEESDNQEDNEIACTSSTSEDDRIPLLHYEQDLMLDTFVEDVVFILARGLGMERLFLNHLHLYSDRRFTVFVLNTLPDDEHYFLERLKQLNPKCPPKVITSEVLVRDRELVYKTGGVQFVTSRILMVDLLTNKVPIDRIAGILVYRAHELLNSYQESFILRLFREKKSGGFVKAFTDNATAIAGGGIGQLQRLIDKLYVKRVRIVPRFDAVVKESFDVNPPKFVEFCVELPQNERKIRSCLMDLIGTCVRELKQCTHGTEVDTEDTHAAVAGLRPTMLEVQLRRKTLLLSERQERLLSDLQLLRNLLRKVEDLDPTVAYFFITRIRADKDILDKNSGWIFTPTAAKIFAGIDALCSVKDEKGRSTIAAPTKWNGLKSVLDELTISLLQEETDAPVLVLASNEDTCRQLIDLVKFGEEKLRWLLTKALLESKPGGDPGPEPPTTNMWNPSLVIYYDSQIEAKDNENLVTELKKDQKKAGRQTKKRGGRTALLADADPTQQKLVRFGIVRYTEKKTTKRRAKIQVKKEPEVLWPDDPLHCLTDTSPAAESVQEDPLNAKDDNSEVVVLDDNPTSSANMSRSVTERMLVFIALGNRYNLINCLETLRPSSIVLYHTDIIATRIIETFKAHNSEHPLRLYALMQKETTEEERYLVSLQREQSSLETLIRDQGVLLVPTEYDVSRENTSELRSLTLKKDSRNAPTEDESVPRVVVDMREFNSELPTVLYRRGIDLQAATLEVGDYILSPRICVERKALDDLAQSLTNGRIFKQTEQMLRNYPRSILLIESNEKFRQRKVNGGPFQGELSRRSRETRSLLTMLMRSNPQLNVLWSLSPAHSAEIFEEIKLDQPNPDPDTAIAIRSDDLRQEAEDADNADAHPSLASHRKLNGVVKRQLENLPGLASGDVDRLMRFQPFKTPADLVQASTETLTNAIPNNRQQAEALADFFRTDFRLIVL